MISFFVSGRPAPKGSRTRGTTKDGRHYTRPASRYERPWTDAVALVARAYPAVLPPYRIDLTFRFDRPPTSKYAWPVTADIDKLARCTLDALQLASVIANDKHVVDLRCRSEYGSQGCAISISRV